MSNEKVTEPPASAQVDQPQSLERTVPEAPVEQFFATAKRVASAHAALLESLPRD